MTPCSIRGVGPALVCLLMATIVSALFPIDPTAATSRELPAGDEYRLPTAFTPEHYKLAVITHLGDADGFSFSGNVRIKVNVPLRSMLFITVWRLRKRFCFYFFVSTTRWLHPRTKRRTSSDESCSAQSSCLLLVLAINQYPLWSNNLGLRCRKYKMYAWCLAIGRWVAIRRGDANRFSW